MYFASDNWAGVAPEVSEALSENSKGFVSAYGDSDLDQGIHERFREIFETDCAVFFVGTGTAANSMALSCCMQPGGVGFCHSEAHLFANEGGAPEFLTGGGRISRVGGAAAKIDPTLLGSALSKYPKDFNHLGQAAMVSITQSTEGGTCYSLDEIEAIGAVCSSFDVPLHMDGARFANALVNLDCTPAEMTWKRGVRLVSFGGTKNGCWCAEALIVLDPELCRQAHFIRKRMGHLFSKSRFIAAQFQAYLEDDLWKSLARTSNAIGRELREMIRSSPGARLAWESDTNQVFMIADRSRAETWLEKGAKFYPFPTPVGLESDINENEQLYRLVTSFSSSSQDVSALEAIMREGT